MNDQLGKGAVLKLWATVGRLCWGGNWNCSSIWLFLGVFFYNTMNVAQNSYSEKKYRDDTVFQLINKKYLTLSEEERKINNEHFKTVCASLIKIVDEFLVRVHFVTMPTQPLWGIRLYVRGNWLINKYGGVGLNVLALFPSKSGRTFETQHEYDMSKNVKAIFDAFIDDDILTTQFFTWQ